MVTGKVPFDADTPVSVALKHMQEKPVEPIKLNPAIPQSLNDLIMKAMEKEPSMRYNTATEMIQDLDRIIKNPEVGVTRNTPVNNAAQKIEEDSKTKKNGKFAKFKKFLQEHKAVKIALIVVIFLVVFFASIGITMFALNAGKAKDVTLPDFSNLTVEEARQKAEEANLSIEVAEEKYDVEIEEGKIISQDPKYQPNFTVKEGTTIKVVVSKGQEIVTVTKLVGKTKDEAIKELKELGLEAKIEEDYNDDIEAGIVVEQSIAEGEEVLAGSQITLKVSLGIEQVEVPDLTGLTEDEAKAKIEESKLKYKATYKITDSSKGKGVVEQSISPHSFVDKNSEITITINEYQEIKRGTINIDVASLIQYKPTYQKVIDEETGEEKEVLVPPKQVTLVVTVNDEQVESKQVSEDETNFTVGFDGEGTVRIKVIIDGSTKATKDLNLNTQTTIDIS